MPQVQLGTLCATHPGERATAACRRCGKPICSRCQIENVAADTLFCSIECRDSDSSITTDLPGITTSELLAGYNKPIVTGWKLWLRSLPALALHITPLALLGGIAFLFTQPADENAQPQPDYGILAFFLVMVVGVALVQVVLSQQYTRLVQGNAIQWTMRRFFSWVTAEIVVGVVTMLGFFALIIPGGILSLRLFWADEFALVHGLGPIRALKESWRLTEGEAGHIFVFQLLAGLASYIPLIACALVFMGISAALAAVRGEDAAIGLIDGVVLSFFVLSVYSALHAPEIVYFYGMRASRATHVVAQGKVLGI